VCRNCLTEILEEPLNTEIMNNQFKMNQIILMTVLNLSIAMQEMVIRYV